MLTGNKKQTLLARKRSNLLLQLIPRVEYIRYRTEIVFSFTINSLSLFLLNNTLILYSYNLYTYICMSIVLHSQTVPRKRSEDTRLSQALKSNTTLLSLVFSLYSLVHYTCNVPTCIPSYACTSTIHHSLTGTSDSSS